MKIFSRLPIYFIAILLPWANQSLATNPASEVALVTSLAGSVSRITAKGREPVQAFVKLKQGDMLALEGEARIQMVFFESNRQESWSGIGRLEIAGAAGKGWGLESPQVKVLPDVLVKQIAKTPTLDSQGRAGAVRLRAIATPDALAKLDNDYKRLRMESVRGDLNPEMFLLASLLEMRQLDRLEQALANLQTSHPDNMEAKLLAALYQRSLRNVRESGK